MNTTIISLFNQKGGVGKTTTAINLAFGLKNKNKKVLLVDLDPQANATRTLLDVDMYINVYNLLLEKDDKKYKNFDSVYIKDEIDILPSDLNLANLEQELINRFNRELILKKELDKIKDRYDFIIVDCPPNLGLLSINALCASDKLIVPICLDYFSLLGINSILKYFNLIKDNVNSNIEIMGYLINKFDKRKNEHKDKLDILKKKMNNDVFKTIIRTSSALSLSQENSKSIFDYDNKSRGAEDYNKLTDEILKKINI